MHYKEKLQQYLKNTLYTHLPQNLQKDFVYFAQNNKLSFQNINQSITMLIDMIQWDEEVPNLQISTIDNLKKLYENYKNNQNSYQGKFKVKPQKISFSQIEKESIGFGLCPVASPKTRCCNLLTLDVVESCGFDCSYCSIQSFYSGNAVSFHTNVAQNLQKLTLDPNEIYHIGTGQSSDSLMWGDKYGTLTALNQFAKDNPNIILELKTKSDNINFLIENEIAKNIIVTWSLNPQSIIDNEEHLTASLTQRIEAAQKVAQKGILVGFHFHPMIEYQNWHNEYAQIVQTLIQNFDPKMVAMISIGTLTFIKPVLKKIRQRDFHTKILQMPLENSSGKLTYPKEIKLQLFQHLYNSFAPWHNEVYFYLCMEDHSYWKEVFGKEYPTNESFELDMKLHYKAKIDNLREEKTPL